MGGVDIVVFTGGIGENSVKVRHESLSNMQFLGIEVDEAKNTAAEKGERDISTAKSKVRVVVIPTNEELVIAMDTMRILKGIKNNIFPAD